MSNKTNYKNKIREYLKPFSIENKKLEKPKLPTVNDSGTTNKKERIAYLTGALDWMAPYDTGCTDICRTYLAEYESLTGQEFPESPLYLD